MILANFDALIKKANEARKNSYAPYSTYRVGAALLCADGTVYTGCNVENAAYGETVCAERVAIFKAISEGKRDFDAISIVGGIDELKDFAYPCGACRPVLSEFCAPSFKIVLFDGKNTKLCTLGELFPASFGKASIQ